MKQSGLFYLLTGVASLVVGLLLALAFFVYRTPEMAFWLDGFSLCN